MTTFRARRLRHVHLSDRLLARALALGATSEHVTASAVDELRRLAGDDQDALSGALARLDYPDAGLGHPGAIATALLRAAIDHLLARQTAGVDALDESGSP